MAVLSVQNNMADTFWAGLMKRQCAIWGKKEQGVHLYRNDAMYPVGRNFILVSVKFYNMDVPFPELWLFLQQDSGGNPEAPKKNTGRRTMRKHKVRSSVRRTNLL